MSELLTPGSGPAALSPRANETTARRRVIIWAICVLVAVLVLGLQAMFPEQRFLPKFAGQLSDKVILAVFLSALLCEYIDSALGMGYGTTLTPMLLLAGFAPLQIVPAVLFSEFCTGLCAALAHHREGNVDFIRDKRARGTTLCLSALSVVGAIAGVSLALSVPKFWLKTIIAIIVLSVGFVILVTARRQLRYRAGHIIGLGAIAAFNKALSGGGYGPLVTGGQVVSGISAKQAVGVTSMAEGLTCLVGLIVYFIFKGMPDWSLALPLTLGAMFSIPVATLTIKKLPETAVRLAVGVTTCALGVFMVIKLVG